MADQYSWEIANQAGYKTTLIPLSRHTIACGSALNSGIIETLSSRDKYLDDTANMLYDTAYSTYTTVKENSANNFANSAIIGFSAINAYDENNNYLFTITGSPSASGILTVSGENGLIFSADKSGLKFYLDERFTNSYFKISKDHSDASKYILPKNINGTYNAAQESSPYNSYTMNFGENCTGGYTSLSMINSNADSNAIAIINSTAKGGGIAIVNSKVPDAAHGSLALVNSNSDGYGSIAAVHSTVADNPQGAQALIHSTLTSSYVQGAPNIALAMCNSKNVRAGVGLINSDNITDVAFGAINSTAVKYNAVGIIQCSGISTAVGLNRCEDLKIGFGVNYCTGYSLSFAINECHNGAATFAINNCSGSYRGLLINGCHDAFESIFINNSSAANDTIAINHSHDAYWSILLNNCSRFSNCLAINFCGQEAYAHEQEFGSDGSYASIVMNYCHHIGNKSVAINSCSGIGQYSFVAGYDVHNITDYSIQLGWNINNVGSKLTLGCGQYLGYDTIGMLVGSGVNAHELWPEYIPETPSPYYHSSESGICILDSCAISGSVSMLSSYASAYCVALNNSTALNNSVALNYSSAVNNTVAMNHNKFNVSANDGATRINDKTIIVQRFYINEDPIAVREIKNKLSSVEHGLLIVE